MTVNALLLNASYEPLQVVSWQRALTLVLSGKAAVLEASDEIVRTVKRAFRLPAVLRLLEYVRRPQVRRYQRVTRPALLERDGHACQYCGTRLTLSSMTIDHVVPRSRGGGNEWTNVVAACGRCNHAKAARTPREAGLKLRNQPREPGAVPFRSLSLTETGVPDAWRMWLEGWGYLKRSSS